MSVKTTILSLVMLFTLTPVFAQVSQNAIQDSTEKIYDFINVQKVPEYPGGARQFMKYIKDNLKYPQEDIARGPSIKIFLKFVVEKDGSITNIKITRPGTEGMNKEAIRLITESRNWTPGYLDNKIVRVSYNTSINFIP